MMVQIPWRLLILTGIPEGVMANVADCAFSGCCFVWFMDPFHSNELALAALGCHSPRSVNSMNVCTGIHGLPTLYIGQGQP